MQQKNKNPFQRIVTSMYLRFFVNNRKYLKLIKCVILKTGSSETRLTRETCHQTYPIKHISVRSFDKQSDIYIYWREYKNHWLQSTSNVLCMQIWCNFIWQVKNVNTCKISSVEFCHFSSWNCCMLWHFLKWFSWHPLM